MLTYVEGSLAQSLSVMAELEVVQQAAVLVVEMLVEQWVVEMLVALLLQQSQLGQQMLKCLATVTTSVMATLALVASMSQAKSKSHSIDGKLQMVGQRGRKTRKAETSTMPMRRA